MIIGVDEVGRGAWAGPLAVAAVGLDGMVIDGITDSKLLTGSKRREYAQIIRQITPHIGLAWVHAGDIDKIGLSKALTLATQAAVNAIDNMNVDQIIIDGTVRLIDDHRVTTLKKADLLVPSVSAAAIIAKVARDEYMRAMAYRFSNFGFEKNVGYGTKIHAEALLRYGPTPIHRYSFKPVASSRAPIKLEP